MAWLTESTTASFVLISDDSYYQPLSIEYVPTLTIGGAAVAFEKTEATLRVRERVTELRGLTKAAAFAINGDLSEQIKSSGTYQFESHNIKVSRRRANEAGGWVVTKTEKWAALYLNGVWNCGTAATTFDSTSVPAASTGR